MMNEPRPAPKRKTWVLMTFPGKILGGVHRESKKHRTHHAPRIQKAGIFLSPQCCTDSLDIAAGVGTKWPVVRRLFKANSKAGKPTYRWGIPVPRNRLLGRVCHVQGRLWFRFRWKNRWVRCLETLAHRKAVSQRIPVVPRIGRCWRGTLSRSQKTGHTHPSKRRA